MIDQGSDAPRSAGLPTATSAVEAAGLGGSEMLTLFYAQPSCLRVMPEFQIFVMWRIRSPSNSIT